MMLKAGNTGVRVLPGMGIPEGTAAMIILESNDENLKLDVNDDTEIISRVKKGSVHLYKIRFKGEGLRTVTVKGSENTDSGLFFYALPTLDELMDRRARFISETQYYRKYDDPLDHGILCYDLYHKRVLKDPMDMWGSGGYEGGITDAMFLAMKNVYRPDKEQIKLLETYIHKFVLGKLQNSETYGVAWTVGRPHRTERGYNYMHNINLYEAMTRVARTWPALTQHNPEYYLDLCWKTYKAFSDKSVKYQDLGLMGRGNITFLPELLRNFEKNDHAIAIEKAISYWAKYWQEHPSV